MAESIAFDGIDITQLYSTIVKQGVSKSEASVIVGSWIFENLGRTKRVFNFAEPFPETEPACTPAPFAREFEHPDWVDGENVVQAGQTPGEIGFNERFHQIERDLDRLGGGLGQVFTCMAEMRASLHALLGEIRTEINRLNADVYEAGHTSGGGATVEKIPSHAGLLDFGKYTGTTQFFDKKVSVWQTDSGTLLLPTLDTVGIDVLVGPKVQGAANLDRYIVETEDVRKRFPEEVSSDDLVKEFGDEILTDGRSVRDVVNVLPAGSKYKNLDALVEDVSEREASQVRTSVGADVAVTAALGIDSGVTEIGTADVNRLESIPTRARAALIRGGVTDLQTLANTPSDKVSEILKTEGVSASAGDAASWTRYAGTLMRLRTGIG
ncbi:hypothetical protein OM076_11365 [Solirubrobacter ginsenosidimutans]|uniref:Uncharacterized protein n=1 Tax=Solirubrobacter ginsenosidimutans TaxID=490573 RepID=A0A9X3MTC5_9ACTN|nr:hypothetical protein [Solirubrobacter ginsenosidimutans]MDA0160865.1 hypothetical protein [Solirubrobacter ginsenosidimutans]